MRIYYPIVIPHLSLPQLQGEQESILLVYDLLGLNVLHNKTVKTWANHERALQDRYRKGLDYINSFHRRNEPDLWVYSPFLLGAEVVYPLIDEETLISLHEEVYGRVKLDY